MGKKRTRETHVEKEARLARINTFFTEYCNTHHITVEQLAQEADVPVDNIYKWIRGDSYAPLPKTINKLCLHTGESRRILSLVYNPAIFDYVAEVSDEEWIILEQWRKLKNTKRNLFEALIVTMLAEDTK